jgi:LysM repeat protein
MVRDGFIGESRRRVSVERWLYLAVIGGLLLVIYRLVFPARVYLISVNGKSVAVVRDQRTAQGVLDGLKKQYFPEKPHLVVFEQQVVVQPIASRGERVMRWSEAQEKLARVVKPAVQVYAIYVDDESLVILPTEADAQECLERVKRHYVPREATLLSSQFQETVRVKPVLASPQRAKAMLKTQREGVEILTSPAREPMAYVVQPGDTFTRIAHQFDVTLTDLQFHNPGVDVHRLQVGDRIRVASSHPPLTVITRVEEVRLENGTRPWTVRKLTPALARGTTKVIQEGSPAKQRVRLRITYVNDTEQVRRASYEEIVQEAVPRKILVGTG